MSSSRAHLPALALGPLALASGLLLCLPGCSSLSLPVGGAHLTPAPGVKGSAPAFSDAPPLPAPPKSAVRQELYSVVMQNVDVQELLFALARDAKLNVDIHPSIAGTVTMNVHDQTLAEILDRVARQVDLRYEIKGSSLSILPDTPYLMHYRVDYPNIRRDAKTTISTSTDVASTGGAPGAAAGASASNGSTSSIENTSNNRFWDTLLANLKDLLRETDMVLPDGTSETITEQTGTQSTTGTGATPANSPTITATGRRVPARKPSTPAAILAASPNPAALTTAGSTIVRRNTFREAAYVVSSPETGNISVRASQNQHEKVREFLDRVLSSARRQVLIEATIVEVDLSSRYQQGINWSLLQTAGKGAGSRIDLAPAGPGTGLQTGGLVSSLANLTLKQTGLFGGNTDLSAMLSLMESFGTLRVLSSPKISVLNNQTSVLKVVDNKVYFTLNVTPATYSNGLLTAAATYSTTINTVPIGFLMTVVPQVSESNEVTLTLRPTISRITGYATDPNPALSQYNIVNRIPEVQTREMESVLRVQSGDIAVLGGLMQDTRNDGSDEVPGLNRVPILSNFFKFRNDSSQKSELVIFLRPTVLYDASLAGDFRDFRSSLSEARQSLEARPLPLRSDKALQRD